MTRFRPGTDVALVWGILWHIFENGWEDEEFIRTRVLGMDQIRAEVANWTPDEVERVTGAPGAQLERVARTLAENRPGTVIWCMGGTQHTNGNNNARTYSVLQLALGTWASRAAAPTSSAATTTCRARPTSACSRTRCRAITACADGAWAHWARVWEEDAAWLRGNFAVMAGANADGTDRMMVNETGIPVWRLDRRRAQGAREHRPAGGDAGDGVLGPRAQQPDAAQGDEDRDGEARPPRGDRSVPDPLGGDERPRGRGVPAAGLDAVRDARLGHRVQPLDTQWRDQVVAPLFESLPDHTILAKFSEKFGFADRIFRNIAVENGEPLIEDLTREFNRGMWTIGYTAQSPERLKAHMANQHTFDRTTLRAVGGPVDGDFYGMPWPAWGTPEMNHPGTANLYDLSMPVAEGGLTFRARFGVEYEGENLLAEGVYTVGSEIEDGYPEFTMQMLQDLGWDEDLTQFERATIEWVSGFRDTRPGTEEVGETTFTGERPSDYKAAVGGVNWKTDLSGGIQRVAIAHGCAPFGNAKARAVVWTFPDPVPLHREPLYTPRRDLLPQYSTYGDKKFWRVPTRFASIQETDFSTEFPIILTSGRLVEYEGGGDETRSNPWLAELQQEMFVEINPGDANDIGVGEGSDVWVEGPESGRILVKALVTDRVGRGVAFMPFHFGGISEGRDLRYKYPEGADPIVLGESTNTAQTYGYDSVTQMQETKSTLCKITAA